MKFSIIAALFLAIPLFAECTLENPDFIKPVAGWDEFVSVKLNGVINPNITQPVLDPDATGTMVLAGKEFDPTVSNAGKKRNYWIKIEDSILGMIQGNFRWIEQDKMAVATLTQMQIPIKTLNYMKANNMGEFTDTGAITQVDDVTFEINESGAGIRKICHIGASTINVVEQEGQTYNLAEGKLYGCLAGNTAFAEQETLGMLINTRITSDEAKIEEFFTAFSTDPYQKCTCYQFERDNDGNLVEEPCATEENDSDTIADNDVLTNSDNDILAENDTATDSDQVIPQADEDVITTEDTDSQVYDNDNTLISETDTENNMLHTKSDSGCGCSVI